MKYGIWRHENSIGNSAEHTIGLYKHLLRNPDPDPTIYVETESQAMMMIIVKISICQTVIPSQRHTPQSGKILNLNPTVPWSFQNTYMNLRDIYQPMRL